jgi:hypothetical protein
MRKIVIILIIAVSSLFADNSSNDCIKTLYNQRDYLVQLYLKCKPVNLGGKLIVPCIGKNNQVLFDTLVNKKKPISIWYENKYQVVEFFFELYKEATGIFDSTTSYYLKYKYSDCVNDSMLVNTLLACMCDTTLFAKEVLPTFNVLLFKYTAYSQIMLQSYFIIQNKNALEKNINEYHKLRAILNNDREYNNTIIARTDIPLEFRARLGDTLAANELIRKFTGNNNYNEKASLAENLIFTGNPCCIKTVIEHLFDTTYQKCRGVITETLRIPVYTSFRRWYPDAPFSKEFNKCINASPINTVENVTALDSTFIMWAIEKFGVKPDGSSTVYILKKECEKSY